MNYLLRIILGGFYPLIIFSCSGNKQSSLPEINDSTTPLHLLKPDYVTSYGVLYRDGVKTDIDRVFSYIDSVTPAYLVDSLGNVIPYTFPLPDGTKLNQGTYRLTSYEWGVTYMALLDAYRTLDDSKYLDYVTSRIGFINQVAPGFADMAARSGMHDGQMRQIIAPATLDDAGAMSAAFMRAALSDSTLALNEIINRQYDVLLNDTHRLSDGTIARNRPHRNSVWLDDMFMAIPAMVARAQFTSDPSQLEAALEIAIKFIERMWIPEKRLFRHGYVEGIHQQPSIAWGRANGWALLALSQLLDAISSEDPRKEVLLDTVRSHIAGLTAVQGADGLWHQLLDRNDSFEETSASAIFTYCIAHAINEGWIDAITYAPIAHLGWEAVASKINCLGEVEDVCVGTGMAFDPTYYYYRPVSVKAAHGYGPVIWAGTEIIRMLDNYYPRVNDSAVHYYRVDPEASAPIFSLGEDGKALEVLH